MGAASTFLITLSLAVSLAIVGSMAPPPLSTKRDSSFSAGIPVTIINALPGGDSGVLDVDCDDDSYSAEISSGDEYKFFFSSEETDMSPVLRCDASWGGQKIATFDQVVDTALPAVYWRANVDGVYLSWDKKSWRRKAVWRYSERLIN